MLDIAVIAVIVVVSITLLVVFVTICCGWISRWILDQVNGGSTQSDLT